MRRRRGGIEGDSAGQASGEERGCKRPRKEGDAWTIGVVSDTHGEFDPHLMELLSGVDEIWHGGDHAARNGSAASAERVLNELCKIAPVTNMVRGNVDVFAGGLRGHRGHRPAPAELQAAFPLATLRALPCGAHLRLRAGAGRWLQGPRRRGRYSCTMALTARCTYAWHGRGGQGRSRPRGVTCGGT